MEQAFYYFIMIVVLKIDSYLWQDNFLLYSDLISGTNCFFFIKKKNKYNAIIFKSFPLKD